MRVLDLAALRSFVAVAEQGGVTRAAGVVHLTQSAVSMQIKRLEDALDLPLFERRNRTLILTSAGEQLLSYARRMLDLNDEALSRLTDQAFEGEIVLGVPHDIVHPVIPRILKTAAREFPRIKIHLKSSYTVELHRAFEAGEADIILTTETAVHPGGHTLAQVPLIFVGAPDGTAWQNRPLPLAFPNRCLFRRGVQDDLSAAHITWENRLESEGYSAVEATVSADLAVHAVLAGTARGDVVEIDHGGT
ncbi:MAG: LysR family transcriptional regulator, partial [Pseudomonadota bacterium]